MDNLENKYRQLQSELEKLGRVAVAFSGGVDSSLLLKAAADTLGKNRVLALTVTSSFFPERELAEARGYCRLLDIEQLVVSVPVLDVPGVSENPVNRCYLCKHALFERLLVVAKERGIDAVAEGSNLDDCGDYRPGMAAVEELGIRSPLRDAGLDKEEIRALSKRFGLPTWDKPARACLASRFVYGEHLSEEKLRMVEQAEAFLTSQGFGQFRVRVHGEKAGLVARIELPCEDFPRLCEEELRVEVCGRLRELGFSYVALDLEGFRSGSMNEMIGKGV